MVIVSQFLGISSTIWNFGIEIVNTNQQVCFAIDIIQGVLVFRGYIKDFDNNIFIFDDGLDTMVISKMVAKELLTDIDHIFDHKSHSDTLGRRNEYPEKWINLMKSEKYYTGNGKATNEMTFYDYNPFKNEYKY